MPVIAQNPRKPLKKGAAIKWTTGCRFGQRTNKGTVVCFVPAKTPAEAQPKAADAFIQRGHVSNRDRYVVKRADGSGFCFANANAVVA